MQNKLLPITEAIIQQFTSVEEMLNHAIVGLKEKDKIKLENIINVLEPQVNQNELIIEDECTKYIALFNPEAKNLRGILMMLKMNNDAERAGDLGVNIAESSLYLIERPSVNQSTMNDIFKMATGVLDMFKDSIRAFIDKDSVLAREVIRKDHKINHLQENILKTFHSLMIDDSKVIKRASHFIRIAHNLERIGDLSTNICEDLIYLVEGKIVKHSKSLEQKNSKIKILYICVENSFRSQMAEALTNFYFTDKAIAESAGSNPIEKVNPNAVQVLSELDIDMSNAKSKGFDDVQLKQYDYVVTMGCKDTCPYYPAKENIEWDLPDIKNNPIEDIRNLRDTIKTNIKNLLDTI